MNPRSCDEREKPFCVFQENALKITINLHIWAGHSKLISLEIDEFFKITPNFYEKEANVTGKTE